MTRADRSELLGLDFERARMAPIVARCLAWCREPRSSHIVVTGNASHLCMMRRDARSATPAGRRTGGRRRHVGRVGASCAWSGRCPNGWPASTS